MTTEKIILIAGGTGMIGVYLKQLLESRKHTVRVLTRHKNSGKPGYYFWDPENKIIDDAALNHVDAVINLAGESIASGRWTAKRKRKIINSRIFSTNFLFELLKNRKHNVSLFINASAIGYYGNTGEKIMHEDDKVASDFLAQTSLRWENAAKQIATLNIRTVILRIGLVLANEGGMFPEIRNAFRLRIAPVFGTGEQYQSWIHIQDLCRIFNNAIRNEQISGIYNAVAPGPISNSNFIKLMTQIIDGKYVRIKIPEIVLKIIFGEFSNLLAFGSRVSSRKIEDTGFTFTYPQANQAINNLLQK